MDFLPLFPLNLVVFPHEDLHLHIFEPRYRQLINECLDEKKTFGIPSFVNNKLLGYGTEVALKQLSKRYGDGRMDIKTKGLRVFKVINFQNPAKDKLYAGGDIAFVENEDIDEEINPYLLSLVEKFYYILKVKVDYEKPSPMAFSHRIAHKIGISIQEEYEILITSSEKIRQELLIIHLERIIPVLTEVERTKERIAMNGHFKELDPLNF